MLLAVDIGNTQTVIGAFVDGALRRHWRVTTSPGVSADEIGVLLSGLLDLEGMKTSTIDAAVMASVVPTLTASYAEALSGRERVEVFVIDGNSSLGFQIAYDHPHEVGADRLANCLAALDRYQLPAVVVDFGTATTFDVISADGAYLGGVIAAGVEASLEAIVHKAGRLSGVELEVPRRVIGANTAEALRSGIILGAAAMVDGMIAKIASELGEEPTVAATGGFSTLVAPLCASVGEIDPMLTISGLYLAYRRLSGRA